MPYGLLVGAMLLAGAPMQAQLSISNLNQNYTINFDSGVSGVSNGGFRAAGFETAPGTGQLDSDAWSVAVNASNKMSYGGSSAGMAALERGVSAGGETTGGIYAYQVSVGNYALGANPSSTCFTNTNNYVELAVINNTGHDVGTINLDYNAYIFSDQLGYTIGSTSYRVGNSGGFISMGSLNTNSAGYTAPVWAGPWGVNSLIKALVPAGDTLHIRWTLYGQFTSNSDEVAIDDIVISMEVNTYTYNPGLGTWSPASPVGATASTLADTLRVDSGNAVLTGNTSARYVQVAPGASLNISSGSLSVRDSLVLQANANAYAQLVGQVNGLTRWETFLESAGARWFNLAVPVDLPLADLEFSNGGFIQATGSASKINIYQYDAAAVGSGDAEGDWVTTNLTEGADSTAYSVYLGGPYFGSLPMTMSATGSVLNGNMSFPLTPQGAVPATDGWGWNFVPNPYPSALSWDSIVNNPANAGISKVFWVLDDESSQWRAYNSAVGPIGPTGDGTGAPGLMEHCIAPGQGFFVQSVSTSQTSLQFRNTDRVVSEAPAKKGAGVKVNNALTLWVKDSATGATDYNWIGFEPGTSDNWDDGRDAVKRFNDFTQYPALYNSFRGIDFIYNFVSDAFSSRSIPLNFKYDKSATLTFSADLLNLDPSWTLMLEDKVTGKMTDLRQADYTFSTAPHIPAARFILYINKSSVSLDEQASTGIFAYTTESKLMVNLEGYQGEASSAEVYDLTGRLVARKSVNAGAEEEINLSSHARAMYILRVSNGHKCLYTQKLLVQ